MTIEFDSPAVAPAWPVQEVVPSPVRGLPLRELIAIATLFWLYVTLSNVFYAYSLRVDVEQVGAPAVFAPSGQRVLQHVLLFPLLLASYWLSLRVGWKTLSRIAAQIAMAAAFAAVTFWAMVAAIVILNDFTMPANTGAATGQHSESIGALWLASFINFLLTYAFGLTLVSGLALYRRMRDSELRAETLERAWSGARLAALRMQLSPHTLFNQLHTIRGQIGWDPPRAQAMMVQLADLMRRLLNDGERDFSLLADELRFVRLYLELQQQRFPDRLIVQLPDVDAQPPLYLPSLILQPLVENAIVHGLAGHGAPITIRVEVLPAPDALIVRIVNSKGADQAASGNGIGLRNVRERLAVQFGPRASLAVGAADDDTWRA